MYLEEYICPSEGGCLSGTPPQKRVWCEVNGKGFLIKSSVGYGAKRANERTQFRLVRTMEFVFRCIARFSSRVHLVVSPWVWSLLLSRRELKPGFEKLISDRCEFPKKSQL